MMRDIFQSASLVVAWLGTTSGFEYGPHDNSTLHVPLQASDRPNAVDRRGLLIITLDRTSARDILSRPYWGRVWIIQELCVAKDIIVMSDSLCISWSTFGWILQGTEAIFSSALGTLSVPDFRLLIPYNLVDLRNTIRNGEGKRSLGSLLTFASQSEATVMAQQASNHSYGKV